MERLVYILCFYEGMIIIHTDSQAFHGILFISHLVRSVSTVNEEIGTSHEAAGFAEQEQDGSTVLVRGG